MALRIPVVVSLSLVALGASLAAQAQAPAPFKGDAVRGHDLTYTCNGCHAVANYKNVYPTYSVPKLSGQRPEYLVACLACHGTNGVGITADYPTIAGQHKDYIERALHDYQKGGRKNPIMAGMAATLTPEDIEALATYYSGQTPALETVPRKTFFFSSAN